MLWRQALTLKEISSAQGAVGGYGMGLKLPSKAKNRSSTTVKEVTADA